ncbi:MAG: hypothetical protein AAGA09_03605 [Pseudomonadota bacterium]
MNPIDQQNRKEAVKSLITIALLEGAVLMAVVGVYLNTNNITHLIVGVVGSSLLFGPLILRWAKNHGGAMKAKPNSVEDRDE